MSSNNISMLIVDDDEDDLFLIKEYLSGIDTFKITVDTETNYNLGRKKILQNEHDVYIVDYLLRPETGLELIRSCIKAGVNKPYILLTGKGDKRIDIEAAQTGAYDYLTKSDLNAELLERSLRYSLYRYSAYTTVAESEKKYREIFNKSNDIIFVLDNKFEFVNFNPMMSGLLGYEFEELAHKSITTLFEDQEQATKFLYHIQFSDSNIDTEIILLTKSGGRKAFLSSCSRILSPDGSTQYQGILYDYTNIKKSFAEQILKEKIEATSKLVRSLAHEIRNPLTNINLSVHQLEENISKDDEIYTDIIKRNSKRINDLIGELMHISNPSQINYERIEVNEIVQDAINMARDRIKLKNITVSEQFLPNQMFIEGDKTKIQTALLNIIINAVEAMENQNGQLSIETSHHQDTASIKIKDNGNGITPENIPHLFQPYFTGKKNGMGLGLATTHSAIKAHNGDIEVESFPGQGTSFTVKLKTS